MDVASHMRSFNRSECFNLGWSDHAILEICLWHRLLIMRREVERKLVIAIAMFFYFYKEARIKLNFTPLSTFTYLGDFCRPANNSKSCTSWLDSNPGPSLSHIYGHDHSANALQLRSYKQYLNFLLLLLWALNSVTRKKSTNVYKSCLKMISVEKW